LIFSSASACFQIRRKTEAENKYKTKAEEQAEAEKKTKEKAKEGGKTKLVRCS